MVAALIRPGHQAGRTVRAMCSPATTDPHRPIPLRHTPRSALAWSVQNAWPYSSFSVPRSNTGGDASRYGLEHALRHKLVKPGDIGLIISVAQDSRSAGQPITSDAGSLTPKRCGRCSLGGFPRGNDRREYRGRGGECSISYCL